MFFFFSKVPSNILKPWFVVESCRDVQRLNNMFSSPLLFQRDLWGNPRLQPLGRCFPTVLPSLLHSCRMLCWRHEEDADESAPGFTVQRHQQGALHPWLESPFLPSQHGSGCYCVCMFISWAQENVNLKRKTHAHYSGNFCGSRKNGRSWQCVIYQQGTQYSSVCKTKTEMEIQQILLVTLVCSYKTGSRD